MAAQGARSPLRASWWAPESKVEKAWQYNQQPPCCHFDQLHYVCVCVRVCVCVCVCVCTGLFCQKPQSLTGICTFYSLFHTQHRHTTHACTHTDTHVLWSQQGLLAAISSLLSENEPLSLVTTGPLCQNIYTHTHTHTHTHTYRVTLLAFWQPVDQYGSLSQFKLISTHIDLFSVTARFTWRKTHRWTMVNTIHVLLIIINPGSQSTSEPWMWDFPLRFPPSVAVFTQCSYKTKSLFWFGGFKMIMVILLFRFVPLMNVWHFVFLSIWVWKLSPVMHDTLQVTSQKHPCKQSFIILVPHSVAVLSEDRNRAGFCVSMVACVRAVLSLKVK